MIALNITILMWLFAAAGSAQCVDETAGRTGLRFSNQSSYGLTFFVDHENEGVFVQTGDVSSVREVTAGEHLLRARAEIGGVFFWVWVINEVPGGQICTWTVQDPPQSSSSLER
jgi:hypothetical protein